MSIRCYHPLLPHRCAEAFEKADQDKDGVLALRDVAAIIRAENDEFGFLDQNTMPTFIKAAFAAAKPDEEKRVRIDGFTEWYPAFLDHVANLKLDYAEAARIKVEAKAVAATAASSAFSGTGLWECDLKQLLQALEAARAAKRTPLLIDGSGNGGDGFTPLETFFSYSGHQIWETKKTTVDVLIKKTASLEEALEEQRKKLLLAMVKSYLICICVYVYLYIYASASLIQSSALPGAWLRLRHLHGQLCTSSVVKVPGRRNRPAARDPRRGPSGAGGGELRVEDDVGGKGCARGGHREAG